MATNTNEEQQPSFFGQLMNQLPRFLFVYFVINFASQALKPTQPVSQQNDASSSQNQLGSLAKPSANLYSTWKTGELTDFYLYLDPESTFRSSHSELVMSERNIPFANFDDQRKSHIKIPCNPKLQNNGSLYAHFFLTKDGIHPDQLHTDGAKDKIVYQKKILTRYQLKKKVIKKKKLVGGDKETDQNILEEIEENRPIISHWWKNLTINTVAIDTPLPSQQPPQLQKFIQLDQYKAGYLPIMAVNDFWMLQDDLLPINSTVTELDLYVDYSPISFWKFQLYTQFDESLRVQTEVMGHDPAEQDQMKRMFLDTNPWLLGVTIAVSLLHSLFDFLAFKNDINFWKNKKSMEGISFRSLILGIFFQAVIFLYLLDNDTSFMILVSQGIGLLIEVWKINKTVIIKPKSNFPYVDFIDRVKPSRLAAKTQKYDQMAFSYLSYALFPCMALYALYSLQYEQHKSWYSFIIGTMVGFVYTFGFIQLTPQLFINYKLKSVAHMPFKTFIYKALNTFIDDLFAFVIKMPWLHRLACLRDDVVFLIYLYQRWIYREDKRRRNEFGQVGEDVNDENDDESNDEEEQEVVEPFVVSKTSQDISEKQNPVLVKRTVNNKQDR